MHPVLDHTGLIGIEAQTVFQRLFGQVIAFAAFLQAANVIERRALQLGVRLRFQQSLPQIAALSLQSSVGLPQTLLQQTQVDVSLTKTRRAFNALLVSGKNGLGMAQTLLQGPQIEQCRMRQVWMAVGTQPKLVSHTRLFGKALLFQLLGLCHQLRQGPCGNQ